MRDLRHQTAFHDAVISAPAACRSRHELELVINPGSFGAKL